jgi:hypothetical protein
MDRQDEINDFVNALVSFIKNEMDDGEDMTYSQKAVKIVDARNHLFRKLDNARTDEADDIFALKELCILDDDMHLLPDMQHIRLVARNYWY